MENNFATAYERARSCYSSNTWSLLSVHEICDAIYAAMRALDVECSARLRAPWYPMPDLADEANATSEHFIPDTNGLISLAVDAYLVGHEQVAQDLAALASHLVQTRGCTSLRAVAKEILARASAPRQGFATLLDPFDLSGLSSESKLNRSPTANQCPQTVPPIDPRPP
jgi:hypothetical protein